MPIREQVKSGQLTSQEALSIVSTSAYKGSPIVGWLKRRGNKGVPVVATASTEVHESEDKPVSKYKKKHYQKPKKS